MMQGSQMNAQQMKVYIAPDDHTDYMWSGDEVQCSKAYPARTFSLLSVSDPDVLLWTVKPAEEGIGAGIVIKVWNLEDENRNCMVSSPYPFKSVRAITHIENDRVPLHCED